MVSFASLIMKNLAVFPARSKHPVKLIFCIAFGSVSNASCLLKFIAIMLQ